jgi:hypothetical protein
VEHKLRGEGGSNPEGGTDISLASHACQHRVLVRALSSTVIARAPSINRNLFLNPRVRALMVVTVSARCTLADGGLLALASARELTSIGDDDDLAAWMGVVVCVKKNLNQKKSAACALVPVLVALWQTRFCVWLPASSARVCLSGVRKVVKIFLPIIPQLALEKLQAFLLPPLWPSVTCLSL